MASLHVIAVVLLCLSGCNCEVKKAGSKLEFGNLTEVNVVSSLNKEFDGKGLEPWYDIAKSFIHTVQKDDLPYDDIKKIKDNDNFDVPEFLKGWELPFLIVLAIGVLFALVLPIVGLVFCCCRLCGNCGGEMVQKPGRNNNIKRIVFGTFLFIITLFMFTGCLLAFVSNDRITDTVKSYKTTPILAIKDAEKYLNGTVNLVSEVLIGDIIKVLGFVVEDVINLPEKIANNVIEKLEKPVREPLESIVKLAEQTKRMETLLENVQNQTEMLQEKSSKLQTSLTEINKNLTTACNGTRNCTGINYQDGLKLGANFSEVPDVRAELQNIKKVVNNGLKDNAQQGLEEFSNIRKTIRDNTNDSTKDIEDQVNNATATFTNRIKKDITDEVEKKFLNRTDKWIKDVENAFDDYVEPYDKYRYYAGVGLTCLILLPVVLMILGLLCGFFGHEKDIEPTERGTISHIGGNCLMAAVGFMFIFVFFLMLFTSVSFMIGAHLEKGCNDVREGTVYSRFIDNPSYWNDEYLLGDKILNDGSIQLTASGVLKSCRANNALFRAIKGDSRWNLTEKFNVRKELGDIEDKLDQFNVSIKDQNVLNNDTKAGLKDLGDSGVDKITFKDFLNETSKPIVEGLDELQSNLTKSGDLALQEIGKKLNDLKANVSEMENLSRDLEANVKELEKLGGNISNLANDTAKKAIGAAAIFSATANEAVGESTRSFVEEILGYIDQTADHSVEVIENELGRCRIMTDIYDGAVNLLCRETTYPFNGFWFSIGFCLFFYIPAIVLSVKLAKHFRRMKFEEGFDRYDGHEMVQMDRNKPWLNQGNAVYPK